MNTVPLKGSLTNSFHISTGLRKVEKVLQAIIAKEPLTALEK